MFHPQHQFWYNFRFSEVNSSLVRASFWWLLFSRAFWVFYDVVNRCRVCSVCACVWFIRIGLLLEVDEWTSETDVATAPGRRRTCLSARRLPECCLSRLSTVESSRRRPSVSPWRACCRAACALGGAARCRSPAGRSYRRPLWTAAFRAFRRSEDGSSACCRTRQYRICLCIVSILAWSQWQLTVACAFIICH